MQQRGSTVKEHLPSTDHLAYLRAVGGISFGPFLLEERLATGGFAEVWIARPGSEDNEHRLPARLVVKRLLPSLLRDAEARGAFAKEADLYSRCKHPNIVECYGAGTFGDEPWLAMELVVGADFDTVLRAARQSGYPFDAPIAVYLARALLAGLSAVHHADIVHRDVTPSNLYLSIDGDVKLGDFGIARYLTSPRTPANLGVRGKFAYLAPEQIAGEATDARTDLFAVANVLAESMMGRRLFEGSGQLAVLLAVREAKLDNLRSYGQHISPALMAVLERALAKDPAHRYQTADELADALAPFAADAGLARAAIADRVNAVRPEEASESSPEPAIVVGVPSMFPPALPALARQPTGSHPTAEYRAATARVRTTSNEELGPFSYGELVELVASGRLGADDHINVNDTGYVPLRKIDDLAGHLSSRRTVTTQISGPGSPDWYGPASDPSDAHDGVDPGIASALSWIAARRATGALFAANTEIYFLRGRVQHVPIDADAIADSLVEQGVIPRESVERAKAFAAKFGDDLGDALVGLATVDPTTWTRTIATRTREAIVTLFGVREGNISFYQDAQPKKVHAPITLAVGPLIEAGVEATLTDPEARYRAWRGPFVALDAEGALRDSGWSPIVEIVVERMRSPIDPCSLVVALGGDAAATVRAIESARLGRLIGTLANP
jgi:eukaryotic-like serine/threonine-protein kinase